MSEPRAFLDGRVVLHAGDCRAVLASLPDASIDSVVTDPPYALVSIGKRFGAEGAAPAQVGATGAYARASAGFMGKQWDTGETAFAVEFWAQVLRVLKPGGHVVAFGGTRSYHRLACAIEDSGFEIRDQLAWAYGSGFPKSHDVAKGIDKARNDKPDVHRVAAFVAAGRDAAGFTNKQIDAAFGFNGMAGHWTNSKGPQAQVPKWNQWEKLKALINLADEMDAEVWRLNGRKGTPGEAWVTAEVIGCEDKPRPTYTTANIGGEAEANTRELKAANSDAAREWQGWGTALKPAWEPIVLARKPLTGTVAANVLAHGTGALNIDGCRIDATDNTTKASRSAGDRDRSQYRTGTSGKPIPTDLGRWPANILHDGSDEVVTAFPEAAGQLRAVTGEERAHRTVNTFGEFAGSRSGAPPRNDGGSAARFFYSAKADADDRLGSKHPTVKPVDLMQWLCRLVTPPGGTILDPFAGTGTTGEAAFREGFRAVLIEREEAYRADIARRMDLALAGPASRRAASVKARQAETPIGGLFAAAAE